jgi:acetoin utilization protein AcuB
LEPSAGRIREPAMREAAVETPSPYRRRESVATGGPSGSAPAASGRVSAGGAGESDAPASETVVTIPTLREVMTPAPTCVAPESSVLQLVRLLHAKRFRHLLVTTDRGKLVGIISDRDVVRCFGPTAYPDEELLAGIRAEQIMSRDVITIPSDLTLAGALDVMYDHGVSCLPIVDGQRLTGIVTTSDLMRLLRRLVAGE